MVDREGHSPLDRSRFGTVTSSFLAFAGSAKDGIEPTAPGPTGSAMATSEESAGGG